MFSAFVCRATLISTSGTGCVLCSRPVPFVLGSRPLFSRPLFLARTLRPGLVVFGLVLHSPALACCLCFRLRGVFPPLRAKEWGAPTLDEPTPYSNCPIVLLLSVVPSNWARTWIEVRSSFCIAYHGVTLLSSAFRFYSEERFQYFAMDNEAPACCLSFRSPRRAVSTIFCFSFLFARRVFFLFLPGLAFGHLVQASLFRLLSAVCAFKSDVRCLVGLSDRLV